MTPFTTSTAVTAGRLGGRRMTDAKRRALSRLHDSRRGKRVRTDDPRRQTVLEAVRAAVAEPVRGQVSIRALASVLRVSDRTVRRWLDGTDWPDSRAIRGMAAWVRRVSQ